MGNQKYHHLIPKTYLKSWCYANDSLYVRENNTGIFESKNINKNFGVTQFHSIMAGMPICEDRDLEEIYKCLNGYEVYYEEKLLINLREYNNKYNSFDKWVIKRNGVGISQKNKNVLQAEIDKVKIMDIENLWAKKYENKWNCLRENIEYKLLNNKSRQIDEFYKGLMMKSLVAFNWRGFNTNDSFKSVYKWISDIVELDKINIPIEDRQKKYLETASEEMEHYILLNKYREFLRDTGVIYDIARNYIKLMNIKFYVADCQNKFITSDNPSFINKNIDGKQVHIMPISPNIVMVAGIDKENEKQYWIDRITDEQVCEINKIIFANSIERIIVNSDKVKF